LDRFEIHQETRMADHTVTGLRQVRIEHVSPEYWRATLDNPPLNIMGPEMVAELAVLIDEIEADDRLKVIVFDSSIPEFFMAHYDVLRDIRDSLEMTPGPTGMHPFPDFLVRLSRAPVVSICSIRGRATGSGSEIALACDIRFASREKAVLSHWEVGAGFAPGGGPMARLPRLVGRGRALEILLGADDINGELAELYGYVNRSLPDAELDGFVDRFARRIASFDRHAIALTKGFVDGPSLPDDAEIKPAWDAFTQSVVLPAAQSRLAALVPLGLQQLGDVETRLGYYVARNRD
jgi:enoyl-CoA hydratase/carnithine racemase